jgi:sugar lactone lactonase YvrE
MSCRSFFLFVFNALMVCGSCQTESAQNHDGIGSSAASFKVTVTRIAGDSTQFAHIDYSNPLKARFSSPKKLVWDDRTQSLFIVDGAGASGIRKMDRNGKISTPLPDVGTSNEIYDVCLVPGEAGAIYFGTTLGELQKYTAAGTPEIIIDWRRKSGRRKEGNETGSLDEAAISGPHGIVAAPNGNIYIANDYYKTIHKIDLDAVGNEVTVFAGKPTSGVSAPAFELADGRGTAATFGAISDMAIDGKGIVYVADDGYCTVRKITPSGVVTSLLTPSSKTYTYYPDKDGPVAAARASKVAHVAVSEDGSLVFFSTGRAVRVIREGKEVFTLAKLPAVSGMTCTPDGRTVYVTAGKAIYKMSLQ